MNDKMFSLEEIRPQVLFYQDLASMAMIAVKIQGHKPHVFNEEWHAQLELSRVEWALRSAEEFLPSELHFEFQKGYIKRWEKYMNALDYCEDFDIYGEPISEYVLKSKHRLHEWSKEYVKQNSSKIKAYMNKDRRKDLLAIVDLLGSVFVMSAKKETLKALETALNDLELAKDEEEMAKDSLPDNFFLTERYGQMEDNVTDLYDAMGRLEDVIEDVSSLNRLSKKLIEEPINEIINTIKQVINR